MSYGGGYGGGYGGTGHRTPGGSSEGSHETHETVLSTRATLADIEHKARALYGLVYDSTEPVAEGVQAAVADTEAALERLADLLTGGES